MPKPDPRKSSRHTKKRREKAALRAAKLAADRDLFESTTKKLLGELSRSNASADSDQEKIRSLVAQNNELTAQNKRLRRAKSVLQENFSKAQNYIEELKELVAHLRGPQPLPPGVSPLTAQNLASLGRD